MTKKSNEKKSTIDFSNVENTPIMEGKQAFYILHEIRNKKGLSISELCRKIGIANTSYHRYLRYYEKQQRNSPSLTILSKFAAALGCEIQIVEKKSNRENSEGFEREFIHKTEFNVNNKAVKYKLLPNNLIGKYIQGDEYEIYIRKHLHNDKLYDFYITEIGNRNKYVCSNGRVGAEHVYNKMEEYNINPFNQ